MGFNYLSFIFGLVGIVSGIYLLSLSQMSVLSLFYEAVKLNITLFYISSIILIVIGIILTIFAHEKNNKKRTKTD